MRSSPCVGRASSKPGDRADRSPTGTPAGEGWYVTLWSVPVARHMPCGGSHARPRGASARAVTTGASATSGELLFERRQERAAAVVAEPARQLVAGKHAVGLGRGALAVHPLGLDRVQPRAPA